VKSWKIFAITTLATLTIGGIYLYSVWKHRQAPGVPGPNQARQTLSDDDLAVVRALFPGHFDDLRQLEGTAVWMKNGYTMPYFPYQAGHIVFNKRMGVIPSAQQLDIKKVIKAAPPAQVDDGISHGTRQALAIFSLPHSSNLYATVIGAFDGDQEQYFCDVLFYYDDPHKIYDNWPPNVWAAIDAHQVMAGMSELQTQMSIGHNQQVDSTSEGNRTITYDQAGKKWTVTFVGDKATTIQSQ